MAALSSSSSSSLSATLFPLCNSSSSISSKPKLSSLHFLPNASTSSKLQFQPCRSPMTRVLAAPEVLEQTEDTSSLEVEEGSEASTLNVVREPSSFSVAAESDKLAPKNRIRIKLKSYYVPLIEDSCKQIIEAAKSTNAKTVGPVPLPTKKRIYCVLKSPHVHKDARFHFEIRTHQRLIDILYPTGQTIDTLMTLDLPNGVDVEVKV